MKLLWVLLFGTAMLRPVMAQTALESTLDLSEKFRPGVSLMWSPCGQAAWDELRAYHHVGKIEMLPLSHTAELLNAFQWQRDKTLPDGTVIFGGDDSPAFRERVREELQKKCGRNAAQMIGPYKPPGPLTVEGKVFRLKSALFVSALSRALRFPGSFADDAAPKAFLASAGKPWPALGFGTTGTQSEGYRESIVVLDDDLKGRFCLRFKILGDSNVKPEFLVLMRDAALTSFDDAIHGMRKLLTQERHAQRNVEADGRKWIYTDTLEANDTLWMPQLHAALSCDFLDLVGKPYLRTPIVVNGVETMGWWEIREAQQLLNFRLNHQGALVEAVFKMKPDFLTGQGEPIARETAAPLKYRKTFIFDKPFIASFWREGADYPYLACWVDGPEMLVGKK